MSRIKHLFVIPILVSATTLTYSPSSLSAGNNRQFILGGVAASPGSYQTIDIAGIEKNRIDWSTLLQKQDQVEYERARDAAREAYLNLYNNGLVPLRKIYNETFLNKTRIAQAAELNAAIDNFNTLKDQLGQSLAMVDVVRDVWASQGQQTVAGNNTAAYQAMQTYQRGGLNLKALSDTVRAEINKIVVEAASLQYGVSNNAVRIETAQGQGLSKIGVNATPEFIQEQMAILQNNLRFSEDDKEKLGRMSLELKTQMANFVNSNDMRMYWLNELQSEGRQNWIDSLVKKARVITYARGVYCMPTGVFALDLPKPEMFNKGYISRNFKDRVRLVQKVEFDTDVIRSIRVRMDEVFTSLRSQNGDYDKDGGFMGYLNRANSTLKWENEVVAYLSIMKIIRDLYIDEVDLSDSPVEGCSKVRARYNAKYGSFKDAAFQAEADAFLFSGISSDSSREAFKAAGSVILSKGDYYSNYRKFMRENPTASILGKAVNDDPELK